jgi:hypothetical protein
MQKWIIANMIDCLVYGFSFEWFFNNRKEDYLKFNTEKELKKEWDKQKNILGYSN